MARKLSHAHWGAFEADVVEGRIAGVAPFEHDRDPSALIRSIPSAVHAASRIGQPMIREGYLLRGPRDKSRRRGGEPFVPVTWDHALNLIAEQLTDVKEQHGNQAIFGGSYGWSSAGRINHARTLVHRFLYKFGGCVDQVTNYSWGAAAILLPHIVGGIEAVAGPVTDWPSIIKNTDLMILFGGAAEKNMLITTGGAGCHESPGWFRQARDAGVEFLSISPLKRDCGDCLGAEWLPIRPGADTALMLAVAHELIKLGRVDLGFLRKYTVGYDRFRDYVTGIADGIPKSAEWACGLTGIAADKIVDLANRMSSGRTMLSATWSLQRADHGEQPYWALIALAAMLGQIGLPGGGFGFGYGSINGMGTPRRPTSSPAMEAGKNPLGLAIPVARIADLLLQPGRTIPFDGKSVTFPDIKLVYWCGGNPFHHHQDINRLVEAWNKPDTIIVHEVWWTATAQQADIVLPATTTFEREDVGASPRDRFIVAMPQLIEPVGQARNDYDIFSDLAGRLGFRDQFTEGRDIRGWIEHAYEHCRSKARAQNVDLPTFNAFWQDGFAEVPPPEEDFVLFADFRADPDATPLRTPSGRIEIFSETIAGFNYADCPGHPVWLPPKEWHSAGAASRYPLHMISNQPSTRLHSQLDDAKLSKESKIDGREPILINCADAAARGIRAGDTVRVFNDRGACLAGAQLSDDVIPGVVQLASGAWYRPDMYGVPGSLDLHGNPNMLTRDEGTSRLGQGPSAQSVLVEVERFSATKPGGTFQSPEIKLV
ncbi:Asp-tRNA(Asn)/Glu-tRNA(Gln) amidotransferase GatCAB subunit C [Mesorhizobium sp. M3A.F.Ca.ET.174.01.1.1]|uniref:molybdopterin-dependent oxidoreductase n=1 Tax=unclassified Mesorhizobium TaxID=325217 RepID=UPI001093CF63|nr:MULTISPECIES: molybdopterin-dependent oxidoreductase [unclassified Mesorhizobium]TGS87415.1 Asp-tRNA(Asn)/Glu-tRNA(Gln) amidotransferase GatCAB subunit C [Mesorhizobium sp. M3A.F.Ca.ET.175.01.1.1]TGT27875.1 Asp-tRNA(Asn)/Glu-tRNA(Gln) amidotransferase GatCAB subunit C [Mesorhizobium sp. M3A.F.Ca.ET.174.01.1.1]